MSDNMNLIDDGISLNQAEKRAYSRVSSYFQAMYRKLNYTDEPQICPRMHATDEPELRSYFASNRHLPEEITDFLLGMDAKLDTILAQMRKDSLSEFFANKLMVIEVSASGLLVQDDTLQVNDNIELVMFMGEFPPRVASACAKVLRQVHSRDESANIFALQFTKLRESDREEIIRFVFQEERQRIRNEKLK